MALVKQIFVRMTQTGAKSVKDEMADVAKRAEALSKIDPTVKINAKVDKDGLRALTGLRLQLDALKLAGADPAAFRGLAMNFRSIGDSAEGSRLRTAALRGELAALRAEADKAKADSGGGFFGKIFGGKLLGAPWPVAAGVGAGVAGSGLLGILPLLFSAGLGLGSFGLLGKGVISGNNGLVQGISGVTSANENFQNAASALSIAIGKSPADLKAYQAVLAGLEPDLKSATLLLANQNTAWQNLSPSQRKSVIALSDNSAALKTLLPDQRAALTALLAERTAWDNLSPAQQKAARQYQALSERFQGMQQKLAPTVLKLATIGLGIANKIVPNLPPFAQDTGKVLIHLAQGFDKFASSPGFKSFLADMQKLSPSATAAIGEGLGKIAISVGKLLEALVSPHGLTALKGIFLVLQGVVDSVRILVPALAKVDDAVFAFGKVVARMFVDVYSKFGELPHAGQVVLNWFGSLPGKITGFLSGLPGMLASAGEAAIHGLLSGLESELPSVLSFASGIAAKIASLKGPIEKDRVLLVPAGVAMMQGLRIGMLRGSAPVLTMASQLGVQISDKLMDAFMSRNDKHADAAALQIAALLRARMAQIRSFIVGIAQQEMGWASLASAAQGPAFANPRWVPGHAGTPGSITFSHTGAPVITPGSAATHGHWAGGVRPPTGRQLLRNLRLDLGRLRAFGHVLGRLRHMGLSNALIQQLIAEGPDQGYQIAEAILDAGRGEVRALDRTENQIWKAGLGIGKTAARSQFGNQVNNFYFNGFIAGDKRAIAREIQKLLADLKRANGGGALGIA